MWPCNHRSDSWATTSVRDAEGLVEVEVAYISAKLTKLCVSNHGVGVCSVDVDLTTGCVNEVTDLHHGLLIDAVGGGVGNHESCQGVCKLCNLLL